MSFANYSDQKAIRNMASGCAYLKINVQISSCDHFVIPFNVYFTWISSFSSIWSCYWCFSIGKVNSRRFFNFLDVFQSELIFIHDLWFLKYWQLYNCLNWSFYSICVFVLQFLVVYDNQHSGPIKYYHFTVYFNECKKSFKLIWNTFNWNPNIDNVCIPSMSWFHLAWPTLYMYCKQKQRRSATYIITFLNHLDQ